MSEVFSILGLPRSRTAWFSAFLTTDESICLHDPSRLVKSFDELHELIESYRSRYKYVGVCDTGTYAIKGWKKIGRTVIILRDVKESKASFFKNFYPIDIDIDEQYKALVDALSKQKGQRIHFNAIDISIFQIWNYLMPNLPFSEDRYNLFKGLNITVDPDKYINQTISGSLCEQLVTC